MAGEAGNAMVAALRCQASARVTQARRLTCYERSTHVMCTANKIATGAFVEQWVSRGHGRRCMAERHFLEACVVALACCSTPYPAWVLVTEASRKKRRNANKSAVRSIAGVSMEVINKRRSEKPEVRFLQRCSVATLNVQRAMHVVPTHTLLLCLDPRHVTMPWLPARLAHTCARPLFLDVDQLSLHCMYPAPVCRCARPAATLRCVRSRTVPRRPRLSARRPQRAAARPRPSLRP
eukprot:365687-Chlamydomonas_euryale.AAC.8